MKTKTFFALALLSSSLITCSNAPSKLKEFTNKCSQTASEYPLLRGAVLATCTYCTLQYGPAAVEKVVTALPESVSTLPGTATRAVTKSAGVLEKSVNASAIVSALAGLAWVKKDCIQKHIAPALTPLNLGLTGGVSLVTLLATDNKKLAAVLGGLTLLHAAKTEEFTQEKVTRAKNHENTRGVTHTKAQVNFEEVDPSETTIRSN